MVRIFPRLRSDGASERLSGCGFRLFLPLWQTIWEPAWAAFCVIFFRYWVFYYLRKPMCGRFPARNRILWIVSNI